MTKWVDYWNRSSAFSEAHFRKNMEVFLASTASILNFGPDDVILDIGCGPGALAEHIHHKVAEVHCMETSRRYADICRRKFENAPNVFVHDLDPENYLDFSQLAGKAFSHIICLSVVQYYRHCDEMLQLIQSVKQLAVPRAKLLIADIPANTGFLGDLAGYLIAAAREKWLFRAGLSLFHPKGFQYRRARKQHGLLVYPDTTLDNIIRKSEIQARIITDRLTLNSSRKHLLATL